MINQTNLETPVAFIIFNRPDLTKKVFKQIKKVKPNKLFVVADGARSTEEEYKCIESRKVIDQVDWDCEVFTNFSDYNMSSPIRCSTGLDWVFSQVEEAIILEDDCLPEESFFYFCQNLLEYYRDDKRIMHISGNNFQFGIQRNPYSYYFSKYNHNWGWATWKRAWQYFDFKMKTWTEFKDLRLIKSVCEDKYEQKYWTNIFDKCVAGVDPHWDYAWTYACWSQNGLSIIPSVNLVSNLGFREDATRTKDVNNARAKLPTNKIVKINHPDCIAKNVDADIYSFNHIFGGNNLREIDTIKGKIKLVLSKIKRKIFAK